MKARKHIGNSKRILEEAYQTGISVLTDMSGQRERMKVGPLLEKQGQGRRRGGDKGVLGGRWLLAHAFIIDCAHKAYFPRRVRWVPGGN